MKNRLKLKITCYAMLGIIITCFFIYFQDNPAVLIRTEISPIDEETYKQLGLNDMKILG